mgnify:CR=1 FL=1
MKKFILASVALIAVFASCKKEDIRTVYKTKPAEVTITVKVIDALVGTPVTATITSSEGTVNGNEVKITGNNAISKHPVTITAKYGDYEPVSGTITVEDLLEGGNASYSITIIVGHAIDPTKPVTYKVKHLDAEATLVEERQLEFATHSHDGSKWVINNTEFVLFGVTNYEDRSGLVSIDKDDKAKGATGADLDFIEKTCNSLSEANPKVFEEKEYSYTVSAFSYFNVIVSYSHLAQPIECYRVTTLEGGSTIETLIGTITLKTWSSAPTYKEIASPDHASHYVAGHGVDDPHYSHGHGHGGSNAGGGIVVAD